MKKLLLFVLLLSGCSDIIHYYIPLTEIKTAYYNGDDTFTVSYYDGNILKFNKIPKAYNVPVVVEITDNDKSYYQCDYTKDRFYGDFTGQCTIYLPRNKDVEGGVNDKGKFGNYDIRKIEP